MSWMSVGALVGALLLGPAAATLPLQNPDFEAGDPGQAPSGWILPATAREAGYRSEISADGPQAGKAAGRLWRDTTVPARPGAFGALSQSLDATALRGHRIRYSAAVRVVQPSDHIGLWLRVDATDGKAALFDNMADRPIKAPSWAVYTIEGYVPQDSKTLLLGLLLKGDGDVRIDSARLEDLGPAEGAPIGEAKAYLDQALDLLEKNHINSAKGDWPKLRAEAYVEAAGATTPAQTHTAIRTVIRRLGERHTFLRPPTPVRTPQAPPPTAAPLPVGRMQGPVAVLSLPRLVLDLTNPRDDGAPYQAAITTFLKTADSGKACGWIIDLRNHGGGDMWPAMRALAPLLGDKPSGAFVNNEGRRPWSTESSGERLARPDAPVAVILGPRTASSGEMIAIGFVGRPATRSFGQPTAGLTTANAAYPLSDGAVLALTSSYVEDRLGHRYDGPMIPDETVSMDLAEQAALTWLAGQGCKG